MLRLRACLSPRWFRLVTTARIPCPRATLHTRPAASEQYKSSNILSNDDEKKVNSLRQPDSLEHQAQPDAAATFKLYNRTGYKLRPVQRSFPNGKSENLLSGLEQLVSSYHHDAQGSVTRNKTSWRLNKHSDAISMFHFVKDITTVDKLSRGLESISQAANHRPHHVCYFGNAERPLFGIMCTTHNPRGLSLKDVKIAQEINKLMRQLNDEDSQAVKFFNRGLTTVVSELERMMYAEATIAGRAATAEAMRKRGEEVNDDELDRHFNITERLRTEVSAWQDAMSRSYADAKSGKHDRNTQVAQKTTPATDARINHDVPEEKKPLPPKAREPEPDMFGSTALPVNTTPSNATTALKHQSQSQSRPQLQHQYQSPRVKRVPKMRKAPEPDVKLQGVSPAVPENIEAGPKANATSATKSKRRIRYHFSKPPAKDAPIKIRKISVT